MCLHLLDNQTEWPNSLLENLHKEKNTSNKFTGLKTLLFKSINSCKNHHLDPFTDTRCNLWNKNKIAACISIHKQSFSSSKKLNLFVCSFPKLWQCNEWNIISHLTRIDMLCITQMIKHPMVNNYITISDPLFTLIVNILHHWGLKLAVLRLPHFSCHVHKHHSPSQRWDWVTKADKSQIVNGINNKHFLTTALHSTAACFGVASKTKSAARLYSRFIPIL